MEKVQHMMERDPKFSKMSSKSQTNLMVEALFSDNMMGGQQELVHCNKQRNTTGRMFSGPSCAAEDG
jgi:hypothetical protein